jgi:acyl-CoA thioesterase FadM
VRDSRLGGAVYSLRFPVSFKETNTLHRGVYFPNYLTWMGRARELAMREEFAALVPELESGKVGAVTNWASVEIVDDLGASDVVDIRTFLGGRTTSSVTACFDFAKVSPDGDLKTVARGQMAASWVRVRDDLSVEPMPLPAYVRRFLQRVSAMSAKTSRSRDDRGKTLGRVLYATPEGTGRGLSLHKHRFSTTLEDANLVGNIYFSNFFIWQGRILDKFIHSVAPELTRPGGGAGELACVSTKIDFLREAMPFDEINVELGVRKVYECGADLEFTYYRAESNGSEVKLASGLQSAIWLNRRATGRDPSPLPESLRDALLSTPVSTSLLRAG